MFNPFAWQLLITVGALAAHFSREEPIPASRVTIALAGAYVAFAFLMAAPWTQIAGLQDARFFAPDLLGSMNKSYLSPWRLAHVVALGYLALTLTSPKSLWLTQAWARGVSRCNLLPRNGTFVYRVGDFGRSRRWTSRADPGQYGRYWHPLDHGMGLSTAQSRHRVRTVLAQSALRLALAVAAGLSPAVANAAPPCEAPVNLLRFNAPLPGLSSALTSSKPIRIVALGSSSTQGIGASSPKACYPSRLQAELRKRYPDKEIIVDNLGVGGQLATDMIPRIKKDVLPLHPNVVIWQTGVNDAMRQVDVDKFRQTIMLGIDQLQQAGIDVVLLDMQYFPRADTIAAFPRYLAALRQIAEARKVPILQRFAIMKYLVTSAQYTPQQLLAPDLIHPNDFTYGCLGRFLADALQDEVGRSKAVKLAPVPARAKEAGAVAANPVR